MGGGIATAHWLWQGWGDAASGPVKSILVQELSEVLGLPCMSSPRPMNGRSNYWLFLIELPGNEPDF